MKQKQIKKSEASGIRHLVMPNSGPLLRSGVTDGQQGLSEWGLFRLGRHINVTFVLKVRTEAKHFIPVLLGPASRRFLTQSVFQGVHHHCVDPEGHLLRSEEENITAGLLKSRLNEIVFSIVAVYHPHTLSFWTQLQVGLKPPGHSAEGQTTTAQRM